MWTLAQMWHTGSGHMQAFHPSSLLSYWCCENTSHDCWLWQHSDSHNPSQKIGPSSFSPGQARPSLHKTLIDLMDLFAIHTPSPNKQSAQDLSPLRQRGSARPPPAMQHSATAREGSARLPNLLISLLGLGEGLSMLCDDSSYWKSRPPPPFFYQLPGQPELTQVHSQSFHNRSQDCSGQSREQSLRKADVPQRHTAVVYIWTDCDVAHPETSAKCAALCGLLKVILPDFEKKVYKSPCSTSVCLSTAFQQLKLLSKLDKCC